jgi:histone H3/H4
MPDVAIWKPCNICKTPIGYQQRYYLCSVSTCQRKRTGFVFCSVPCFEAHLPMMRHRDAWAEPQTAPTREQAEAERLAELAEPDSEPAAPAAEGRPVRRLADAPAAPTAEDDDTLVVVSKLKKFIRARSGMNTSDTVVGVLSDHLRELAVQALRQAAAEGRKTVMDRDFAAVLRQSKSRS